MEKRTSKDVIVGAKFGRWTVLELDVKNPNTKAKNPPRFVLCQCECGTLRYKTYRDLYSGRSLSCGCLRREQIIQMNEEKGRIEPGSVFGYLTFIEDLGYRVQSRGRQERWSLCQCECGNLIEVSNNNLRSGNTTSCGCISSRGEKLISKILKENNINFSTQYTFNDLITEKGRKLRFDFAIFIDNKLYKLIEFDGRQHYEGPAGNWTHSSSLEDIQRRDKMKDEYCKKNNIYLHRISYKEINKINLEFLLSYC